jgi:hypothetical protein
MTTKINVTLFSLILVFGFVGCNLFDGKDEKTVTQTTSPPTESDTAHQKPATDTAASVSSSALSNNPADWKIDNEIAWEMLQHYGGIHKKGKLRAYRRNIPLEITTIQQLDNPAGSVITYGMKDARYKTQQDEDRFRRMRGIPPGDKKGEAIHCATMLFYVVYSSNKSGRLLIDTAYYDNLAFACPPPYPPECDNKDDQKKKQ